MANKVKYFYQPAYKGSDWTTLNPTLQPGQIGVELDEATGTKAIHMKIGPGRWNDLDYMEDATYPYVDPVTNEIGDVKLGEDRSGDKVTDIIRDMISPYVPTSLSNPQNDAGGNFAGTSVIKIGQSVTTSVSVTFTITAQVNLVITDNIFISAGGVFTNEGFFTYTGAPIVLTLAGPLQPASLVTYDIDIYAVHEQGNSPTVTTKISFQPEIVWGSSTDPALNANGLGLLPNRRTTDNYRGDYSFASSYSYWCVPTQLNPTAVVFSDVTDPNSVQGYSMLDQGLFTINNGVGTYEYRVYRSEFNLLNSTVLRVS